MISFSKSAKYSGISLRLFGDDLDPDEVSSIIGLKPTRSFKRGDIFSQGTTFRKNGMWGLEIKNEGSSPSEDIKKLSDIIPKACQPISRINRVSSGRLSIWIDETEDSNAFEIDFDLFEIELIRQMGVQIVITYFKRILDD